MRPIEPSVLVVAKRPNLSNKSFGGNSTIPIPGNGSTTNKRTRGALRPEPWAVPLLVTAALAMTLMAAFEVPYSIYFHIFYIICHKLHHIICHFS